MRKCANISSSMRRLLVINDFATAPFWISLYMRKILFSFLLVHGSGGIAAQEEAQMKESSRHEDP
jgi:hypothetical protein